MTQTGYANAIANAMLGWLKGVASWVLKLFNLSGGSSPLAFLANNWLKLLIVLLIIGLAMDFLIWLVRWRPYWVWLHKKRVIINDKNFFADEKYLDSAADWKDSDRRAPRRRGSAKERDEWVDDEFVVAGDRVKHKAPAAPQTFERGAKRKPAVKQTAEKRPEPARAKRAASEAHKDVFHDNRFNVDAKKKYSDKYEDEVFNVANLPGVEKNHAQSGRERRT